MRQFLHYVLPSIFIKVAKNKKKEHRGVRQPVANIANAHLFK